MPRHLKNWLKEYARYTAISESPRDFHFWTGVSTLAGALRRRVWIDQRIFQWTPNFYIVLVGPPGVVSKSTSMRAGMELLRAIPDIDMGPQSMTWQGLTQALEEAAKAVPFGEEFLPMSCVTCDVSELGTFLRADDGELVDLLVDLWDGQKTVWGRKLKTQEDTKIINPWINVIGCTTPSWLRTNVPEEMIGGGFISRVLFVYGEKKDTLIPYPADMIPEAGHNERKDALINDLLEISTLIGEMQIAANAKLWGIAWYDDLWNNRPEHMTSERFSGYIGRKQTHLHKLAMILSVAESSDMTIHEHNLVEANNMLGKLERDMLKIFEVIGSGQTNQHLQEIMSFVRGYKRIEKMDLFSHCVRVMSPREFSEALDAGVQAGWLSAIDTKGQGIMITLKPKKEKGTPQP